MKLLVDQVRQFMEQWNMAAPGDRVIVGLSGGADSVCLCLLLRELSTDMDFTLSAVHVEHGIRGAESLADAAFVEQLCRALAIPLTVCHVNVPEYADRCHMSEEEAARTLRYEAFAQAAADCGENARQGQVRVALAHHMEDNAETMLFQLVRGTGIDGLCGIQPVRTDARGNCYIRPLLHTGRAQIESYLAERGQNYCVDATNSSTEYSRNRIRHEVLPILSGINAQAVAHMNRTAERLAQMRDYVNDQVQTAYTNIVTYRYEQATDATDGRKGQELAEIRILADRLCALPEVLKSRIIHRAIGEIAGGRKDIASVHIDAVERLLQQQTGRQIDLPYRICARREYGQLVLTKTMPASQPVAVEVTKEQLAQCAGTGERVEIAFGTAGEKLVLRVFPSAGNLSEISSNIYTKWFDYDMIKNGFFIRSRRSRDYFVMDEAGHRKKLSDHLTDMKIPATARDRIPLLARGSEIFWVIGGRMSKRVQLTAGTKQILEIAYKGGSADGLQQKA